MAAEPSQSKILFEASGVAVNGSCTRRRRAEDSEFDPVTSKHGSIDTDNPVITPCGALEAANGNNCFAEEVPVCPSVHFHRY